MSETAESLVKYNQERGFGEIDTHHIYLKQEKANNVPNKLL